MIRLNRSESGWWWNTAMTMFAILLLTVGVACGGNDDDSEGAPATVGTSAQGGRPKDEILVFAASALTESFKDLGTGFQKANPGTKVTFNFAASSALATQINEAAPADVFASADTAQMKSVVDKQNAGEPAIFAKNTPVIVVPNRGSPVATFADLAKSDIKLVLAAKEVPIGRYAREIFIKASAAGAISTDFSAKVLANLKSDEANVRAVLTKVQLGEADAGIVYRTDVGAAAGEVKAIDIPVQYNVVAEYPIALLTGTKNRPVAQAFVEYVRSHAALAILEKYGFAKP